MEIGIGLNEEYNSTLLFDFDFVEVSGADAAFKAELEALPLALAVFDVTNLTIVSYIPTILMSPLLKTIDLIQLFDSVLYVNLNTLPLKAAVPDDVELVDHLSSFGINPLTGG
jgi:hypothetical protein